MSRIRLNPCLSKIHRSYSVEEVARLYGLHRNTVRSWLNEGSLAAIDGGRPVLVQGKVLRTFLEARRTAAKRPCPTGTLYCFKCREPRAPALGMADFMASNTGSGNIRALCDVCGSTMHRRTRFEAVAAVLPGIEVRFVEAAPRIAEGTAPSLKCA
ncbi:MAG: helix-turn-helix domain-containing protein [Caulobacteraceae bacterium]|nr:helix-turn-helix domain-containing protein [Caulobacteraceae bacterium]